MALLGRLETQWQDADTHIEDAHQEVKILEDSNVSQIRRGRIHSEKKNTKKKTREGGKKGRRFQRRAIENPGEEVLSSVSPKKEK